MRMVKRFVSLLLTGILVFSPVVQPLAVYAQTQGMGEFSVTPLDVDPKDTVGVEPSSEGIGEESDGLWDSGATASGADASSIDGEDESQQDDAATSGSGSDASVGEIPSGDESMACSWRFQNGVAIVDESGTSISLLGRDELPEGAAGWGIDVSAAQGQIDWQRVKAVGVDFAILRLGYGSGGTDRKFAENVAECKRLGIKFGVYLYSYAWDAATAREEALWTVSVLRSHGVSPSDLSLPVYYDLENQNPATGKPAGVDSKNNYREITGGPTTFAAMGRAYCGVVENAGYTPGVYANLRWWNNYLTESDFNNWDRWVAQYNSTCDYKGDYSLWQYSSSGSVDGIAGRVDVNYLYDPEGTTQYMDRLAASNKGVVTDGSYVVATVLGSRQVLDVAGGALYAGANVQTYGANATNAQTWSVQSIDGGYLKIVNRASGKVLSVVPGSSQPGSNVQQEGWNGSRSQKWVATKENDRIVLRSALGKHLVLDIEHGAVNGSNVIVREESSSSSQRFILYGADGVDVQKRTLADGTYSFTTNGYSLDIAGGSAADGAALQLYNPNGTAAQLFVVSFKEIRDGKGYYTIRPAHSQKLLDADGGACYPGATVAQWGDTDGAKQRYWTITEHSDGSVSIINAANGYSLAVDASANGSRVITLPESDKGSLRFTYRRSILPITLQDIDELAKDHIDELPEGTYAFVAQTAARLVLDVNGGSQDNCANVQLYTSNNSAAQQWRVERVDKTTGYVRIVNVRSGKVLDIQSGSNRPGSNVQQYSWNGSRAQLWLPIKQSDGTYVFYSALANALVLDASGAGSYNGTNIDVYSSNGTIAQSFAAFNLKPDVPSQGRAIPDGVYSIVSADNPDLAACVAAPHEANGSLVNVGDAGGNLQAQQFMFTYGSDGYYRIRSVVSRKGLDLKDGDFLPGAKVQQWDYASSNANQKWVVSKRGDGSYSIISVSTGLAWDLVDGSSLVCNSVSSASSQSWKFDKVTPILKEGSYTLQASLGDNVLDVTSGSLQDGANVRMWTNNGTPAQRWYVRVVSSGVYRIQNVSSGKYLCADQSGNVIQSSSLSRADWTTEASLYGTILINRASGKALDVSGGSNKVGANVQVYDSNGSPAQSWTFNAVPLVDEGFYRISSSVDPSFALEVAWGSGANGANVQLYTDNGTASQKWLVKKTGDGWYNIVAACSAKALDISGGSAVSGTNVVQYESNGTDAQKWTFAMGENGMEIISKLGTALDVKDGLAFDGANVQSYARNGNRAQQWHLSSTVAPSKIGYQNPAPFFQVSSKSVRLVDAAYATPFCYVTPSRIHADATREQCVEAFIQRAFEYMSSPYMWNYALSPDKGVDCAGLVMQASYAVGMDLGEYNPYAHWYDPWHSHDANNMSVDARFMHVNLADRKRGDLVFYPGHVAIYLGNDQIIEATPPRVRTASVFWLGNPTAVARPMI